MGDARARLVMDCWEPSKIPIITSLANQFVLFDSWFSSIPGPTDVNRLYLHSGTSFGHAKNVREPLYYGYPQKSIYQVLDEAGYNWASYFEDLPDPFYFDYPRQNRFSDRFHFMETFYEDAKSGKLPNFSFLSPRYFSLSYVKADDQHPNHLVSLGEALIKSVYESLRSSPLWHKSALLLLYDEHGGLYDHVHTPTHNVPNPDGINSLDPPFDFKRLGVRVPAILISPWVDKQVVHKSSIQPDSQFEHSSLLATLREMFDLPPLTKRDKWASSFKFLFNRTEPRLDCPIKLASISDSNESKKIEHLQPLHERQIELVQIANSVLGLDPDTNLENLKNEDEAGKYVISLINSKLKAKED